MSRNWTQNSAIPGSVKPIYGAQYPPLTGCEQQVNGIPDSFGNPSKTGEEFKKYENSVSDAWEASVAVDMRAASTSAARVLERHAAMISRDAIMPPVYPVPSKNSKTQAMQRLATQKEPIPGAVVGSKVDNQLHNVSGLYPKLPEVSADRFTSTSGGDKTSQMKSVKVDDLAFNVSSFSGVRHRDRSRFDRLRTQLGLHLTCDEEEHFKVVPQDIDLEQLRKDCWLGIPHKLRPTIWRILSGYLPTNSERRESTLSRKREEYWHYVEQYFHTRYEEQHQDTFRQIHIDIPRMCPLIPLFQQKAVQEIFERILYIWAIRHPASGYVQGINDLVTPFFVVFLSEFVQDGSEVATFDVRQLPRNEMEVVEADSFWCVTSLLDTIQDNYTFAQPGIQRKILQLRHLMCRVDKQLHQHLENHGIEYLQFAFRWMNNLLMREIPLRATIRLWDTYLSERHGFSQFHVYVCAAFLRIWSKKLQMEKDFQGIMLLLQNLPTNIWEDQQICELTADAYSLMAVFDGAKNHLTSKSIV